MRVLLLAAELGEEPVADVLGRLLREGAVPDDQAVRNALAGPPSGPPQLARFEPQLHDYDELLEVGT